MPFGRKRTSGVRQTKLRNVTKLRSARESKSLRVQSHVEREASPAASTSTATPEAVSFKFPSCQLKPPVHIFMCIYIYIYTYIYI